MRSEPIVNGLREDLDGQLVVLQLNIQDDRNEELLKELKAQFTPTFIIFDEDGQEVWRNVGSLDPVRIRQFVNTKQQAL